MPDAKRPTWWTSVSAGSERAQSVPDPSDPVAGVLATGQAGRMSGSRPDRSSYDPHEHEDLRCSCRRGVPADGAALVTVTTDNYNRSDLEGIQLAK